MNDDKRSNDSLNVQVGGMPLYHPIIQSRAVTAENPNGAKGQGGKEHGGRKGLPCNWNLKKDEVYTFAQIDGPGVIRHIWITVQNVGPVAMRNMILRFYWDNQTTPSVEAPLTDFFGVSHGRTSPYESEYLSMLEGRGFNCYFPMPFQKLAKLTICNERGEDAGMFFFQVDYTIGDYVVEDTPRFHTNFRRTLNTTIAQDYVILDGVKGRGRFMGANIGIIDRFAGKDVWWGEGEVKMFIDGDNDYPTICGTGSEDYAGSAWGLGQFYAREMGAPLIDRNYISFYRHHARDPIYFSNDIRVTLQQMGNDNKPETADPNGPLGTFITKDEYRKDRPGKGLFERVDDVCSTAYWYQTLPTQEFTSFPNVSLRCADLICHDESR